MCPRGNCNAARAHLRQLRVLRVEPAHVVRRVARPALPADVRVEPAVAVGHDVEPGHFLFPQIHRQGVTYCSRNRDSHHRVQERPRAQVFRVPARARQRPRDGRRHDLSGSGFQHVRAVLLADSDMRHCSQQSHVLPAARGRAGRSTRPPAVEDRPCRTRRRSCRRPPISRFRPGLRATRLNTPRQAGVDLAHRDLPSGTCTRARPRSLTP